MATLLGAPGQDLCSSAQLILWQLPAHGMATSISSRAGLALRLDVAASVQPLPALLSPLISSVTPPGALLETQVPASPSQLTLPFLMKLPQEAQEGAVITRQSPPHFLSSSLTNVQLFSTAQNVTRFSSGTELQSFTTSQG